MHVPLIGCALIGTVLGAYGGYALGQACGYHLGITLVRRAVERQAP